jgi:hypothetical protein
MSLPILPEPAFPFFEAIADSKMEPTKGRLTLLKPRIQEAYGRYQCCRATLQTLSPMKLKPQEYADLTSCYISATHALSKLQARIRTFQRIAAPTASAKCQYCCINAPSSFDHYLPKLGYAEFSVLSENLVPCCPECNLLKDDAVLTGSGHRAILSFYFGGVPVNQFLYADAVHNPVPRIIFKLSNNARHFDGQEQTIRSHFTKLDLLDRLEAAAPDVFAEYAHVVQVSSIDYCIRQLLQSSAVLRVTHSPNYWHVAMFEAMAANPLFLRAL